MKRREALTRILNSISEVRATFERRVRCLTSRLQDTSMSKEMKQERLEKMLRDELEENHSERQTPVQSLLPSTTPGAPGSAKGNQRNTSASRGSPTQAPGAQTHQY